MHSHHKRPVITDYLMRHVKRTKGIKRGQKTPRWSLLPTTDPSGPFVSTSTLCADMMTSSNGNNFRVTRPLREWFTVHWWIPLTKACDAELWCFRWCLNKRLSKQSRCGWFDTPSRSLRHHCNEKSPGKNVISKKEDLQHASKDQPPGQWHGDTDLVSYVLILLYPKKQIL